MEACGAPEGREVRGITGRFVLLIATAAVLPLVGYGVISVASLQRGTEQSVSDGNLAVAQQIAQRISEYFTNNVRVLTSIGTQLRGTQLEAWQKTRIVTNHVLDFREFREITVFDAAGRRVASSRVGGGTLSIPDSAQIRDRRFYVAPPHFDSDGLPTTTIGVPLSGEEGEPGWIIAEISLEELWRTVNRIRVGTRGYALLMDQNGMYIAHGNPNDRELIATAEGGAAPERELAAAVRQQTADDEQRLSRTFNDRRESEVLAVAALASTPDWTVLVEQPTDDAFAIAYDLQRQLVFAILLAMLGTVVLGWLWGRSFITRIFALTRATRALAEGRMEERVALSGRDEIRQLGDSFNAMADRLVELQEDVRKQERQAMFGRIAAGLVHDLSHPIQNIVNNCKLMFKMHEDEEYRGEFKRIVEREGTIIKRVLDDLRNIARPMPLERFPVDVNRAVSDATEAMELHAETAGLTLRTELSAEPALIEGDVFALGRVYRNLILNAIQATAPGGLIVAATEVREDRVQVRIYDTGCGIPPERIAAIFDDFVTTKRRGLGLGLAISKKIVEQLGGRISVASEVGRGTTFELDFPRTRQKPMLVAG
jgi:signal transduction histidine kinase